MFIGAYLTFTSINSIYTFSVLIESFSFFLHYRTDASEKARLHIGKGIQLDLRGEVTHHQTKFQLIVSIFFVIEHVMLCRVIFGFTVEVTTPSLCRWLNFVSKTFNLLLTLSQKTFGEPLLVALSFTSQVTSFLCFLTCCFSVILPWPWGWPRTRRCCPQNLPTCSHQGDTESSEKNFVNLL